MLLKAEAVRFTSAVLSHTQTSMARHQESGQDPLRLFLRHLSDFPDRCCVLLHSITSIPNEIRELFADDGVRDQHGQVWPRPTPCLMKEGDVAAELFFMP